MTLVWELEANEDRISIFDYVEQDDPVAAVRLDDLILAEGESLLRFPRIGREGREPGTRELPVKGTPYLLIYELRAEAVRILRVLHGARLWPPLRED